MVNTFQGRSAVLSYIGASQALFLYDEGWVVRTLASNEQLVLDSITACGGLTTSTYVRLKINDPNNAGGKLNLYVFPGSTGTAASNWTVGGDGLTLPLGVIPAVDDDAGNLLPTNTACSITVNCRIVGSGEDLLQSSTGRPAWQAPLKGQGL